MRALTVLLLACAPGTDVADADTEVVMDQPVVCGAEERVVSFVTEDGVRLSADYRPAPAAGAGAVVLFHMIPPGNDRSGYPKRVRDALAGTGVAVLNVDRRGAGASEGVAEEAYKGPGGLRDVEAAVHFLLASGCTPASGRILLVGASNGTTSVHDYVVGHAADLPDPSALVWMSPGTYTENQSKVGENDRALPVLWLFPTTEPWSKGLQTGAPSGWTFVERGAQHGTRMFDGGDLERDTLADLVGFVRSRVGAP